MIANEWSRESAICRWADWLACGKIQREVIAMQELTSTELDERDEALRWLKAEIQRGIDSGPSIPVTPEFWYELRDQIGKTPDNAS